MVNCGVICLFVCLCVTCVYTQVSSICRPNERLLPCGCPKTCKDPAPNCTGVCQMGCFCEEGEFRNDKGLCVKLADCPPLSSVVKLETSEPRLQEGDCPENEEYRFCEPCIKTCDNPNPKCPAQCSRGCFCKDHLLRDRSGRCVPLHECPNFLDLITKKDTKITITLETTKPRLQNPDISDDCPKNEEYRVCDTCVRTCATPNPKCPAECSKGCFCKGSLLRDKDGRCVPFEECSNFLDYIQSREQNYIEPVPYRFTCGQNQVYKECEKCIRSCSDAVPVCGIKCKTGCFCKDGLVKGRDGTCMKLEECPKENSITPDPNHSSCGHNQVYKKCEKCTRSCTDAEPVCGMKCKTGCFCKDGLVKGPDGTCMKIEECPKAATSHFIHSASSVEVEDCTSGEEFFSCGWCEPTCSEPHPFCPSSCTRGCLCRPPLLRHASGKCVTPDQCEPKQCPANEVYVCRSGCESTCSGVPCVSRPRRCTLACYCKLGFLRNEHGQCVTFEMCLEENATQHSV